MKALSRISCLAALVWATHAAAAPSIVVGNHGLIPDTADQKIEIFVTGTEQIQGMNFNLQVADGGPGAGGSTVGPQITDVDLFSDNRMVFFGNSSQPSDPGSSAQLAVRSLTTASGSVLADGLVAIVTVDTTGIQSGTFALSMGATVNGASDFGGVAINITEGSLIVESRPSRIVVGNHALLANTTGQQIQILVTGNDQVAGMNFNLQVADGGPEAGGTVVGPVITGVDLVSQPEMIFFNNSTTVLNPGSAPRVAVRSFTTASGTVIAEGLVAIVTFDTTGIAGGTYPLKMSATVNGDSDFAGVPINIINGSLTIPTPPAPPDVSQSIRDVTVTGATMIEVSFTPAPGWDHFVQFRDQLVSPPGWQDLPSGPHNTGLLIDSAGALNKRFYRLRIVGQ